MGDNIYLDKQEIKKFLDAIPTLKTRKLSHDAIRLMFETLFYGGMRISEVLQITPKSLVNGKIRLEVTKGGVKKCKCAKWYYRPTRLVSVDQSCLKCKGLGKYRIPVDAWCQEDVYSDLVKFSKNYGPDSRLFPITRSWAWHWANQLANARTHSFRHSFLTLMLNTEKFNVRDIMQKARHKSLAVTTEYIESNTDVTQAKENKVIDRI